MAQTPEDSPELTTLLDIKWKAGVFKSPAFVICFDLPNTAVAPFTPGPVEDVLTPLRDAIHPMDS
jgi:hypothetical protein